MRLPPKLRLPYKMSLLKCFRLPYSFILLHKMRVPHMMRLSHNMWLTLQDRFHLLLEADS